MKMSDFLRGVAGVAIGAVSTVFADAKAAVAAVPYLPANIKADLSKTLDDAQGDLEGLAGLGGTELGAMAADFVDDATTLFANIQSRIAAGAPLTVAGRAALAQSMTVVKAQLTALEAQAHAGVDAIGATKAS